MSIFVRHDRHAGVVRFSRWPRLRFRTPTDVIESSFGNDESVKQCLEIMKDVSAEQRARARHLDAKTGTLAGFSATILTLTVALGRPLLAEDLRGAGNMLIEVFFMITVIALTLAALAAIGGVLRPMGHYDLEESQIDAYSDRPKVITDPAELRMTWLRTVTDMALSDRAAGSAKSKFAVAAVVLLIVGLLGDAGQAIT
ncbi:MAG: hypothetical protein ACRDKY_02740, partial [Solirubrobacteraceae bacterium]